MPVKRAEGCAGQRRPRACRTGALGVCRAKRVRACRWSRLGRAGQGQAKVCRAGAARERAGQGSGWSVPGKGRRPCRVGRSRPCRAERPEGVPVAGEAKGVPGEWHWDCTGRDGQAVCRAGRSRPGVRCTGESLGLGVPGRPRWSV